MNLKKILNSVTTVFHFASHQTHNQMLFCDSTNKGKSDTNKRAHVLKPVSSPSDDVSQTEDWTVGGDLLIKAASLQIVDISRLENVRPFKAKLVINHCVLIIMAQLKHAGLTLKTEILGTG